MFFSKLLCKVRKILCREQIKENALLKEENKALKKEISELKKVYEEDSKYYEERIKYLMNELASRIKIPCDLKRIVKGGDYREVDPRSYIFVPRRDFADLKYLALKKDRWKVVLTEIRSLFNARWTKWVFDCDNFALLMAGLLAYAVYKSGFKKQFAFGIAWSIEHAYNVFIDYDGKVWVYEPQTNRVIGELGKTERPYNTVEVWFMG